MNNFIKQDAETFVEMRWRVYQNALANRENMAKKHGVSPDSIVIQEPPINGEIVCDICNTKVETSHVNLTPDQSYLYCDDCVEAK